MRFEGRVGERGEVVIPEDVRSELRLVAGTSVSVAVAAVSSRPEGRQPDWAKLDELVARLAGPMRAELLADGYASFDEYIDDIRGR